MLICNGPISAAVVSNHLYHANGSRKNWVNYCLVNYNYIKSLNKNYETGDIGIWKIKTKKL